MIVTISSIIQNVPQIDIFMLFHLPLSAQMETELPFEMLYYREFAQ